MDDFSILEDSFDECLHNLILLLMRCEETNIILFWEMCHFMVHENIILYHKISLKAIEVDRLMIEVIKKFPSPISLIGIRIFLGHVSL